VYVEPLLSPLFEGGVSLNWGFFFVMTLIVLAIFVFSKVLNKLEAKRNVNKNVSLA
tara:strand:+ start:1008 stop:1175 length:168 start_codon:yes stop_codon:yes gene_type:complete